MIKKKRSDSLSDEKLLKSLKRGRLPKHIAVIMDGNGRWAKKRFLPRIEGHRNGVKSVREIVKNCRKLNISALTLYAFSTENWRRPRAEVEELMKLLDTYLQRELSEMLGNGIRLNTIGKIDDLPNFVQRRLQETMEKTKDNDKMVLTLALSYGSRTEIIDSIKNILQLFEKKEITIDDLTEENFGYYLYTRDLPEPDLLIRTSGELRISNFLLWQLAYTELYFTETLWPDFKYRDLLLALVDYQNRERRFGK